MTLIAIFLTLLLVYFIFKLAKTVTAVHAHWQHYFDDFTYSSQDFYQSIETIINEKEIPDVSTSRIDYSEGGMLSANREYVRVEKGKIVFDICAAPFAKGFFISSWQGELPDFLQRLIANIPFVGLYIARSFYTKTYYQLDTEQMFANAIHSSVLEAIKKITDDMGVRDLTELERQFNNIGRK
ncbi:MAG: hypothetical protein NTZ19_01590 [Bacteroidetes bacterium]|nr:hypothetical protein [Bacteroidota bacterium]